MKDQLVQDWMTRDPITITPDTVLPDAHRLMTEHNIRRLPVMKGKKLVGIVTLGDVREASPSDATSLSFFEVNYLLSRLRVEEIMTRDPVTATPMMPVARGAQLMLEHKISALPVVAHGKLVGIITESDIFRMLVAASIAA